MKPRGLGRWFTNANGHEFHDEMELNGKFAFVYTCTGAEGNTHAALGTSQRISLVLQNLPTSSRRLTNLDHLHIHKKESTMA